MMLNGKIALVTGARGGMGRAIVNRFLKEGAIVYGTDLSAEGSVGDASSQGETFIQQDVTQEDDARIVVDRIMSDQGRLHVLVNAAGIEIEKSIEHTSLEEWNRIFAINVTGTYLTSKHALPLLRAAASVGPYASVINIGSYDGFIADPNLAAYCATKGAVHALTKAMAVDHGPEGIRVNAICPGYIDTPMMAEFFDGDGFGGADWSKEEKRKAAHDAHPLRTMGFPDDIANIITWLASDESRYVSGSLYSIDGGLSAQVQQMRL